MKSPTILLFADVLSGFESYLDARSPTLREFDWMRG
jgi:hypothetical protein